MDSVYFIIRRQKTNIFVDAKESSCVYELKRIVEGILKRAPDEQKLYTGDKKGLDHVLLEDHVTLKASGFTHKNAGPEDPAMVSLALRLDDGSFEQLQIEPFSMSESAK